MLKPLTNTENYTKLVKRLCSQSVVESRFAQSSEITEIIAVYPQVSPVGCEASAGRVNYSGKLILTIVYSDEEGKLCRMQKGAEFSHFADDDCLLPVQSATARLSCDKTVIRRDGSAFVITAIISADISVYERAERSFVCAAEGAYTRCESIALPSVVSFSGESEAEDDFDADSVVDVLIPCAKALVLSAVCGTGEVEVSGEIYLSLFAMRQQSPVCLERVVPFRCSIVCDDASVGRQVAANVEITDLNVTANVNEDRGKCSVSFTSNLFISGWLCDEHTAEVALDAFSDTNEITLVPVTEQSVRCRELKTYSERVSGPAVTKSKLSTDCRLLAAALPSAECDYNPASGAIEGAVCATLVYEQNGEIKSTDVNMPFAVSLSGIAEEGQRVSVNVCVSAVNVRVKGDGETEAEATVKISATVIEDVTATYLCDLEESGEITTSDSAVSVYLPAAGDGLWDVAKKLNKSPADVSACNPELNFPLTGKERIIVYRRKA